MKAKLKSIIKPLIFIFSLFVFLNLGANKVMAQETCSASNISGDASYTNGSFTINIEGCLLNSLTETYTVFVYHQGHDQVLDSISGFSGGDSLNLTDTFEIPNNLNINPEEVTHIQLFVLDTDNKEEITRSDAGAIPVAGITIAPDPENKNVNLISSFTGGIGSSNEISATFDTPAKLVNLIVRNLFTLAGILLFTNILWAGFKFINQGAKGKDEAKSIMTVSIVGFIIMFTAYWIVQIIGIVTGTNIIL